MTTAQERADLLDKLGLAAQNKAALGQVLGTGRHRAGHRESRWSDGGDNPDPAR